MAKQVAKKTKTVKNVVKKKATARQNKKQTKELTIDKVESLIDDIVRNSNDEEFAHIQEDKLYVRFVKHIEKTGNKKQRELAKVVLKTKEIDFQRFYF